MQKQHDLWGSEKKDLKVKPLGSNKEAEALATKGQEALRRLKEAEAKPQRSRGWCCGCCN